MAPLPHRHRPGWLTPNVSRLSAVSFLQDAASELTYPVLPIFLTVTLGAPVAVVGVVEGVAEGIAALTRLVAGRWSDRHRRRPLIGLGYGLAAVGKVLIAVATVWPVVLLGRGVDRVGKGIRGAPRDALLVAGVPPAQRGRVFGSHRAADTAGAVVGPLVGLVLYAALSHRIRPLLAVAVGPAVLSAALVAAVHEPRSDARSAPAGPPPLLARPARLTRPLRQLLLLLTVFGLVNTPDALLLLRAHTLGLSTAGVIGVYAAFNAVYALGSYPAGALADRVPRSSIFALGLGFFAVGYLGLALADAGWQVLLVLPLYGGFAACTDGVGKAWVSSLAPDHQQGRAQGTYQALSGAAVLLAGLWAGLLWHGTGRFPLLLAGSVAVGLIPVVLVTGARLASAP